MLALHVSAVVDLVAQQVGVVFELDLDGERNTQAIPPLPQNSVFW